MAILEVKDLKVHFPVRGGILGRVVDYVRAVDGVSFSIEEGETIGLVGESGSGKSTIGKSILGLTHITDGQILVNGQDITRQIRKNRSPFRKSVQMIFQDVYSSLNPRKRVLDIIAEPLRNFEKLTKDEERKRVDELLSIVGLSPDNASKYPFEFSGGQRQRIGVARAIALKPKLIVCDEPVSALDLSVQAQVLNHLKDIQQELKIAYLFISHDLGVVRHMCENLVIMHHARFVETGTREDIYNNAQHIYTKRLIAAIPDINPRNRITHFENRKIINANYEASINDYYKNGYDVYDLKSVSDTHCVALPN